MVAIYYQLSIIVSIIFAGLIGSLFMPSSKTIVTKILATSIAAIGWTIETLLFLRVGSKLSDTQLIIIWAAFLIVAIIQFVIYTKNKKIAQLKIELKNAFQESGFENARLLDIEHHANVLNLKKVEGKQHYKFFLNSIREATESIYILSGWLSTSVINDKFNKLVEDALKRGVDVFIGYGWQDFEGMHKDNPIALERLRDIYRNKVRNNYSGNILVSKFPNHQKILIVDNRYIVVGSANWLSNKTYKNKEYSFVVYSTELTEEESLRLNSMILKNLGNTKEIKVNNTFTQESINISG